MQWIAVETANDLPLDGSIFLAVFDVLGDYKVGVCKFEKETSTIHCEYSDKNMVEIPYASLDFIKFYMPLPNPPLRKTIYLSYA